MPHAYRHGEVCFEKIDALPENLTEEKTDIFAKGNTGNSHTFKGGALYLKSENEYVFGYFKAKNTRLYHKEHSPKGAELPDGLYRLRRQVETVNGELKIIVD